MEDVERLLAIAAGEIEAVVTEDVEAVERMTAGVLQSVADAAVAEARVDWAVISARVDVCDARPAGQ